MTIVLAVVLHLGKYKQRYNMSQQSSRWTPNPTLTLPSILMEMGLQLAAESIVTSSASEELELSVLRMPQRYWSISSPSSSAVLLQSIQLR